MKMKLSQLTKVKLIFGQRTLNNLTPYVAVKSPVTLLKTPNRFIQSNVLENQNNRDFRCVNYQSHSYHWEYDIFDTDKPRGLLYRFFTIVTFRSQGHQNDQFVEKCIIIPQLIKINVIKAFSGVIQYSY